MQLDSAQNRLNRPEIESGDVYLGEVKIDQPYEKDPLDRFGGRKFILTILGITIFGVFTALGRMEMETYMYIFGGLTAGYFGINFAQKKLL